MIGFYARKFTHFSPILPPLAGEKISGHALGRGFGIAPAYALKILGVVRIVCRLPDSDAELHDLAALTDDIDAGSEVSERSL